MRWLQINYTPDIYEIKVPFTNLATTATNCYVVKDNDDALVIDTGAPTDRGFEVLTQSLAEIGVDQESVRYFCTHLHFDHAGLINRLAHHNPIVYASLADLNTMTGTYLGEFDAEMLDILYQEGMPYAEAQAHLAENSHNAGPDFFDYRLCQMCYVQQDDIIDVGRYQLRVIETPGHTRGHLCLYEPTSGILFGGDHILYVVSPGIELFPDGGDSLGTYFSSLRRCRDLQASQLLIAHGGNHRDFESRIDWLRDHHHERLDVACNVIRENPGLRGMQVSKRMPWNVHRPWSGLTIGQRWAIVSLGVSVLIHLVGQGRIVRKLADDGRYRYYAGSSR